MWIVNVFFGVKIIFEKEPLSIERFIVESFFVNKFPFVTLVVTDNEIHVYLKCLNSEGRCLEEINNVLGSIESKLSNLNKVSGKKVILVRK